MFRIGVFRASFPLALATARKSTFSRRTFARDQGPLTVTNLATTPRVNRRFFP
jgi:hypothetical protein